MITFISLVFSSSCNKYVYNISVILRCWLVIYAFLTLLFGECYIRFLGYFFFLGWEAHNSTPSFTWEHFRGFECITNFTDSEYLLSRPLTYNCSFLFSDYIWSWIKMCEWKYIFILWSVISDPHLFSLNQKTCVNTKHCVEVLISIYMLWIW